MNKKVLAFLCIFLAIFIILNAYHLGYPITASSKPRIKNDHGKIADFLLHQRTCFNLLSASFWEKKATSGSCHLRKYTHSDVRSCFRRLKKETERSVTIVYLGDSTLRQMFRETIYQITGHISKRYYHKGHKNLHFRSTEGSFDFIWSARLLKEEVIDLMNKCTSSNKEVVKKFCPLIIVFNGLLHFRRDFDKEEYAEAIKPTIEMLSGLTDKVPYIIWKEAYAINLNDNETKEEEVSAYNAVAKMVLNSYDKIIYWDSLEKIIHSFDRQFKDGVVKYNQKNRVHFPPEVIEKEVSILLNTFCYKDFSNRAKLPKSDMFQFKKSIIQGENIF